MFPSQDGGQATEMGGPFGPIRECVRLVEDVSWLGCGLGAAPTIDRAVIESSGRGAHDGQSLRKTDYDLGHFSGTSAIAMSLHSLLLVIISASMAALFAGQAWRDPTIASACLASWILLQGPLVLIRRTAEGGWIKPTIRSGERLWCALATVTLTPYLMALMQTLPRTGSGFQNLLAGVSLCYYPLLMLSPISLIMMVRILVPRTGITDAPARIWNLIGWSLPIIVPALLNWDRTRLIWPRPGALSWTW